MRDLQVIIQKLENREGLLQFMKDVIDLNEEDRQTVLNELLRITGKQ